MKINLKHRLLALLLSAIMVLSMVPTTVFAEKNADVFTEIKVQQDLPVGTMIYAKPITSIDSLISTEYIIEVVKDEVTQELVGKVMNDGGIVAGGYTFYLKENVVVYADQSTVSRIYKSNESKGKLYSIPSDTVKFDEADTSTHAIVLPKGVIDAVVTSYINLPTDSSDRWIKHQTQYIGKDGPQIAFKCYTNYEYKFIVQCEGFAGYDTGKIEIVGDSSTTVQHLIRLTRISYFYNSELAKVELDGYAIVDGASRITNPSSQVKIYERSYHSVAQIEAKYKDGSTAILYSNSATDAQEEQDGKKNISDFREIPVEFSMKGVTSLENVEEIHINVERTGYPSAFETSGDGNAIIANGSQNRVLDSRGFALDANSETMRQIAFRPNPGSFISKLSVSYRETENGEERAVDVSDAVGVEDEYIINIQGGRFYTISVTYDKITYTMDYVIGANGTVEFVENDEHEQLVGAGELTAVYQGEYQYVIKADDGYHIAGITINGLPVSGEDFGQQISEYTLNVKITNKRTEIRVEFAINSYNLHFDISEGGYVEFRNKHYNVGKAESEDISGVNAENPLYIYVIPEGDNKLLDVKIDQLSCTESDVKYDVVNNWYVLTLTELKADLDIQVAFGIIHGPKIEGPADQIAKGLNKNYTIKYYKNRQEIEHLEAFVENGGDKDHYYIVLPLGTEIVFTPVGNFGYIEAKYKDNQNMTSYPAQDKYTLNEQMKSLYVYEVNVGSHQYFPWTSWGKSNYHYTSNKVNLHFVVDEERPDVSLSMDAEINTARISYYVKDPSDVSNDIFSAGLAKIKYYILDSDNNKVVLPGGVTDSEMEFTVDTTIHEASIDLTKITMEDGKYTLHLVATDVAGLSAEANCVFELCRTEAEVSVEFITDKEPVNGGDTDWYSVMKAAITVKDPMINRDALNEALKAYGLLTEAAQWNEDEKNKIYICEVELPSGDYTKLGEHDFIYTNKANITTEKISLSRGDLVGEAIYRFCVDKDSPKITLKYDDENTWNTLVMALTFNLATNNKGKTVSATITENNLVSVKYVKLPGAFIKRENLTEQGDLGNWINNHFDVIDWIDVSDQTVEGVDEQGEKTGVYTVDITAFNSSDEEAVIVVVATDKAGNTYLCSTNGLVLDTQEPTVVIESKLDESNTEYIVTITYNDAFVAGSGDAPIKPTEPEIPSEPEIPTETETPTETNESTEETSEPTEETTEAAESTEHSNAIETETASMRNGQTDGGNNWNDISSGVEKVVVTLEHPKFEEKNGVSTEEYPANGESIVLDFSVEEYETCDLIITAYAVDRAQNESKRVTEKLDTHRSQLKLLDEGGKEFIEGIYQSKRLQAVILEDSTFAAEKVTIFLDGEKIPFQNYESVPLEVDTQYIFTIFVETEGKHAIKVTYGPDTIEKEFIIDNTAPEAKVVFKEKVSQKIMKALGLSFMTKETVDVIAEIEENEGVASLFYYRQELSHAEARDFVPMTITELQRAKLGWVEIAPENLAETVKLFSVDDTSAFAVYLKVIDKAGNVGYCNVDNVAMVDQVKPTAELIVDGSHWNDLAEIITFGWFKSAETVTVKAKISDEHSGIKFARYFVKNEKETVATEEDLQWNLIDAEKYASGEEFEICEPLSSGAYVVYLYVEDEAGNEWMVASDGMAFDSDAPTVALKARPAEQEGQEEAQPEDSVYGGDVLLNIDVSAPVVGIKSVKVVPPGATEETAVTLFSYEISGDANNREVSIKDIASGTDKTYENIPLYKDLYFGWEYDYKILSDEYSGKEDQKWCVIVTDLAGNVSRSPINVSIDTFAPIITMKFTDKFEAAEQKTPFTEAYYRGDRILEVRVRERFENFDPSNIEVALSVTDLAGNDVLNADGVSVAEAFYQEIRDREKWRDPEVEARTTSMDPLAKGEFVFSYTFDVDGRYEFTNLNTEGGEAIYIRNTDKAGHVSSQMAELDEKMNPGFFVLDTEKMSASVKVDEKNWNNFFDVITFGIFGKDNKDVFGFVDDEISDASIAYYIETNGESVPDCKDFSYWNVIEHVENEKEFLVTTLALNSKNVVYMAIYDMAGNLRVVNTNGVIIDNVAPELSNECISIVNPKNSQIYNDAVTLKLKAKETLAGIRKVTIEITDTVTQYTENRELFDFNANGIPEEGVPYEELILDWHGETQIVPNRNSFFYETAVVLVVEDMAGNEERSNPVYIDFDTVAPRIVVEYAEINPVRFENGIAYFDQSRTAKIRVYEREGHLDVDEFKLAFTATDVNGNPVGNPNVIIADWSEGQTGDKPDDHYYQTIITFESDANYQLVQLEDFKNAIGYAVTDRAGNKSETVELAVDKYNHIFTVDKTDPEGNIALNDASGWNEFLTVITFGWYDPNMPTVSAKVSDVTSPIDPESVYYLITDGDVNDGGVPPTLDDLLKREWIKCENLNMDNIYGDLGICQVPEYSHVVYLQFKDYAGNLTVINTDGTVVDFTKPDVSITAPNADESFIYNSNVTLKIFAGEPDNIYDSYSGLKSVDLYVKFPGTTEWKPYVNGANLFTFTYEKEPGQEHPYREQLRQKFSADIVLDTATYNYNDLEVKLVAVDNAGHSNETVRRIHIDATAPQIMVSFDNNSAENSTYFKAQRTATISVTERNFDPALFNYLVTSSASGSPTISVWTEGHVGSQANHWDDRTHTAKIVFSADSDYTFPLDRCTVKDKAGNMSLNAVFANNTVAGAQFTVDKINPVITVTYDNSDARNEFYYKENRTATITIEERNFRENLVNVYLTATSNGERIDLPKKGAWQKNGNTYTATIPYDVDGEYTFDISMVDLAGNSSAEYERDSFVIDTVAPVLEIQGVKNETANSGDVKPEVTYSDLNLDEKATKVTLVGTMTGEGKVKVDTTELENGYSMVYENVPKEKEFDDLYTLEAIITDLAGNVTVQTVQFSVNRFGSTYEIDHATQDLNGTYVQAPQDIVIHEINPNELSDIEITLYRNNQTITLVEGEDYEMIVEGGDGKWYKYTYRILSENFEEDGVYRVAVHSKDLAGNVAENSLDTKNMDISFGIDRKAPVITLGNLINGRTYAVELLTAIMNVNDNLKLEEVVVYLDGQEWKKWDDAMIKEILSGDGEFAFDISDFSNRSHEARIYARDAAGNEQEVLVEEFYVTTNLFVRYINNKPLFYGSVAGVAGLIGMLVILIARRKKKEA